MINKQKHSELPFELSFSGERTHLLGHNGTPDIAIFRQTRPESEITANAQYIVKACNSYPKLIEALKKAYPLLHTGSKAIIVHQDIANLLKSLEEE